MKVFKLDCCMCVQHNNKKKKLIQWKESRKTENNFMISQYNTKRKQRIPSSA